jgi:hypothetical protein
VTEGILMLQSFAFGNRDEDRRVTVLQQYDGPAECNAGWFGFPASERLGREFPVRDWSAGVTYCNEQSLFQDVPHMALIKGNHEI